MKWTNDSLEVFYPLESPVMIRREDVEVLKECAASTPRKRSRMCSHSHVGDKLHEMLITLSNKTYVRPHRHHGKPESFHAIEGEVDFVLFDESGGIDRVVRMGDYRSGRIFYSRVDTPAFHSFLIRTDMLIFHEVTSGPFNRRDTEFAPWAPDENNANDIARYMESLDRDAKQWLSRHGGG